MERGELAEDRRGVAIFVFDDLIAHCTLPRIEHRLVRKGRWDNALQLWKLDHRVCDYMHTLMSRYNVPVEVITWHPHGFARALADLLWDEELPVRDVTGGEYNHLSQVIALDPQIQVVYDPHHRFGYGYKARGVDFRG